MRVSTVVCLAVVFTVGQAVCPLGCKCKESNKKQSLFCSSSHLTRFPQDIPSSTVFSYISLSDVVNLKHLDLTYNSLRGLDRDMMSEIPQLTTLILKSNYFSSLPQNVFSCLRYLNRLDLKTNFFSSIHPDMFSGMESLKSLQLAGNRLVALELGVQKIPTVQRLDIGNNRITALGPITFPPIFPIRYIDLRSTSLRDIDPMLSMD